MEWILSAAALKRMACLLFITVAAFLLFHFSTFTAKAWLIWCVFLLAFITDGYPLERIKRIALTGLVSAILTLIVGLSSVWDALAISLIVVVTFLGTFFSERQPQWSYPIFIVNLCAILAVITTSSFTETLHQVFFILCATLIVIFVRLLWMIVDTQVSEFRSWIVTALQNLTKLNDEIFSCFLDEKYNQNLYLFERRIHIQKNKLLQTLIHLRYLREELKSDAERSKKMEHVLGRLEQVHDIMIDCSQLRRRVTDPTIFAVCQDELRAIAQAIREELKALMQQVRSKQVLDHAETLAVATKRFEEIFFNVLQVTAREPLVFLLFISSLKDLREQLGELQMQL